MKSTLKVKVRDIHIICSSWTYRSHEGYSTFNQIDHSKYREDSIGVLSRIDLGSHTRFFTISLFVYIGQWSIHVRTLIDKIPRVGCDGFENHPMILARVGAIAVDSSLTTVQEVWQLLAVMHIARSNTGAVYQPSLTIQPNRRHHSKVSLITFLALVHLRIMRLLSHFGGRRCSNQRSVLNRAARELHSIGLKKLPDLSKERCTNLAPMQQVAEIEQGRRIGYSLTPEVNPAEVTECQYVIQSVFTSVVSQVQSIGDGVHSKYPFQIHQRAFIPHLRVMRFDQRAERSPREKHFHTRQKRHLARCSTVNFKSFNYCQCHLFQRIIPCNQSYLKDDMTKKPFTTYSVFP